MSSDEVLSAPGKRKANSDDSSANPVDKIVEILSIVEGNLSSTEHGGQAGVLFHELHEKRHKIHIPEYIASKLKKQVIEIACTAEKAGYIAKEVKDILYASEAASIVEEEGQLGPPVFKQRTTEEILPEKKGLVGEMRPAPPVQFKPHAFKSVCYGAFAPNEKAPKPPPFPEELGVKLRPPPAKAGKEQQEPRLPPANAGNAQQELIEMANERQKTGNIIFTNST